LLNITPRSCPPIPASNPPQPKPTQPTTTQPNPLHPHPKPTPTQTNPNPNQPLTTSYRVSGSHANPLAVKTDAPPAVVWDIVRCWIKQHPVREPDPNSYAGRLLAKEPKLEANFSRAPGAVSKSQVGCEHLAAAAWQQPGSSNCWVSVCGGVGVGWLGGWYLWGRSR